MSCQMVSYLNLFMAMNLIWSVILWAMVQNSYVAVVLSAVEVEVVTLF